MAAQITHIALTDKVFDRYFSHFDKRDFYIGTVFPDIRHLVGLHRDITHVYELDLSEVIAEPSSFEAGRKFHCLVDVVRDDFLHTAGLVEMLPEVRDRSSLPKFIEDELFYGNVSTWSEVVSFFRVVLGEEVAYGISESGVEKWHKSLQAYFQVAPSNASRREHFLDLGIEEERISNFNKNLDSIRENPEVKKILLGIYDHIEVQMEAWVRHKSSLK
jgi:hypothetical protein